MTYKERLFAAALSCLSSGAFAAELQGNITTASGLPIAGAMITEQDKQSQKKTTVYSNQQGQYSLSTSFVGSLSIRIRAPHYSDVTTEIDAQPNTPIVYDVALTNLLNPQALSDSLPASAHAAMLNWSDNEEAREAFVSQCNYCHQVGNSLTRAVKDKATWRSTIARMEGYLSMVSDAEADAIAEVLSEGFNGKPITSVKSYEYHKGLDNLVIEEWPLGNGLSFIHDADIASNGFLYGADEGHDILWELNPLTNEIIEYPLPDVDMPVGGYFSGLEMPLGVFTGKHGPHSMAEDKQGKLWITNSLSSYLISFDIETKQFESFNIGGDARYLHTVRIDGEGIIWFTIAASNQVGRFDPKTKTSTLIDLPSNGWQRWLTDAALPTILDLAAAFPDTDVYPEMSHHKTMQLGRSVLNMPYGIDVNPLNGDIWYAKLDAHKLGKIDPKTLSVTEIDTPLKGPRRPRFDAQGILWIPAYEENALLRFDPKTGEFKDYPLPTLDDGQRETPYALNIHPGTGDVWMTSNASDRLFRFQPELEKFSAYPSPTRVTFLRDLVFSRDGKICSSQSNLPAYAIEGGRPSFICLDPHGIQNASE